MRRVLSILLLLAVAAVAAEAQDTRASLLRQATTALDEFAPPERIRDLARAALDPGLGAPDTLWVRGVHLLSQVLIEAGEESVAQTWARWAMRTHPTMPIDSVNFLAAVVTALREARTFVGSRSAGDEVTRVTYQWAARGTQETQGRIRFDPSTMPVPVNVVIGRVGLLPAGVNGVAVAPGSYDVEAAAQGFLRARVTREVLPGVTTVLTFRLTSDVVASGTIPDSVRQGAYRSAAGLSMTRFGAPAVCAAGAFVSGQRLVLTSYSAIRGATAISANLLGTAQPVTDVRVAAYDATANLAVLQFPTARNDSSAITPNVTESQAVWGVGFAQCTTRSDARAVIVEWQQRPLGRLRLSETIAQAVPGTPLVDYAGRLTGIWAGGTEAIAAPNAVALLEVARRNIAAQQTLALADVAGRENHLYGTLALVSDVTGASARITQLEAWHWPELATTGTAPISFSGPMGRYRVELSSPGLPSKTQEVVIRPGETVRVNLNLRAAVAGGAQPGAGPKRGVPRWVWLAGLGGGGAALALLGGGGDGGGTGPSTGTVTVRVPVSPP